MPRGQVLHSPLRDQREDSIHSVHPLWRASCVDTLPVGNSVANRRSLLRLFLVNQSQGSTIAWLKLSLRSRHYSRRTEEAYLHWLRRFLAFHRRDWPT